VSTINPPVSIDSRTGVAGPHVPLSATELLLFEIKKVIVGQDHLLERVLVALLARGHVLLEGVPGLAKTLTVRTVSDTIGGVFQRIQFTPDLVPADLVGTRIYDQQIGRFSTALGPVFANLLLADEINRAPAKVQSALLEAMQERQVTIGRDTHRLPDPFFVLATQNPIETEGTYPLPEAQVDRFLFKVLVDYPSEQEEFVVVQRMTGEPVHVRQMLTAADLTDLQHRADNVYRLVHATRRPAEYGLGDLDHYLTFGASPRASINLVVAARALALLHGRDFVLANDVTALAPDVLRHRLMLSYEAFADGVSPDAIITRILAKIPAPARPLADAAEQVQQRQEPGNERSA
jgi:MoxR-like ATPase